MVKTTGNFWTPCSVICAPIPEECFLWNLGPLFFLVMLYTKSYRMQYWYMPNGIINSNLISKAGTIVISRVAIVCCLTIPEWISNFGCYSVLMKHAHKYSVVPYYFRIRIIFTSTDVCSLLTFFRNLQLKKIQTSRTSAFVDSRETRHN